MTDYLKGNYKLPLNHGAQPTTGEAQTVEDEFYRRALEKLGGSIAFILKPQNLLWKGKKDESGN